MDHDLEKIFVLAVLVAVLGNLIYNNLKKNKKELDPRHEMENAKFYQFACNEIIANQRQQIDEAFTGYNNIYYGGGGEENSDPDRFRAMMQEHKRSVELKFKKDWYDLYNNSKMRNSIDILNYLKQISDIKNENLRLKIINQERHQRKMKKIDQLSLIDANLNKIYNLEKEENYKKMYRAKEEQRFLAECERIDKEYPIKQSHVKNTRFDKMGRNPHEIYQFNGYDDNNYSSNNAQEDQAKDFPMLDHHSGQPSATTGDYPDPHLLKPSSFQQIPYPSTAQPGPVAFPPQFIAPPGLPLSSPSSLHHSQVKPQSQPLESSSSVSKINYQHIIKKSSSTDDIANKFASKDHMVKKVERTRSARSLKNYQSSIYNGDKYFGYLAQKNLRAVSLLEDGNCLFACLSDQFYGDRGNRYHQVRQEIVEYLRKNPNIYINDFLKSNNNDLHFGNQTFSISPFERYEKYLAEMSKNFTCGDALIVKAFADLKNVNIVVFSAFSNSSGITFYGRDEMTENKHTLYLAFHNAQTIGMNKGSKELCAHYWSVRRIGVDFGPTLLQNGLN